MHAVTGLVPGLVSCVRRRGLLVAGSSNLYTKAAARDYGLARRGIRPKRLPASKPAPSARPRRHGATKFP